MISRWTFRRYKQHADHGICIHKNIRRSNPGSQTCERVPKWSRTQLMTFKYSLLSKWADYLLDHAMLPPDSWVFTITRLGIVIKFCRTTVDGLPQPNSTNLVIKGIIALKAMSEISNLISQKTDSSRYAVSSTSSKPIIERPSFYAVLRGHIYDIMALYDPIIK